MEQCLEVLRANPIPNIDITGGSPEMHPDLEWFLRECAALQRRLMVRSNGVILLESDFEFFIDVFAECKAEVIISFPHLNADSTDRQRGPGTFERFSPGASDPEPPWLWKTRHRPYPKSGPQPHRGLSDRLSGGHRGPVSKCEEGINTVLSLTNSSPSQTCPWADISIFSSKAATMGITWAF